jgi:hypothetical protein
MSARALQEHEQPLLRRFGAAAQQPLGAHERHERHRRARRRLTSALKELYVWWRPERSAGKQNALGSSQVRLVRQGKAGAHVDNARRVRAHVELNHVALLTRHVNQHARALHTGRDSGALSLCRRLLPRRPHV